MSLSTVCRSTSKRVVDIWWSERLEKRRFEVDCTALHQPLHMPARRGQRSKMGVKWKTLDWVEKGGLDKAEAVLASNTSEFICHVSFTH